MHTKKSKILIVDDISKNIQVVANILQSEKYLMTFAKNGKTALDHVAKQDFDLILLDVMMPDMNGFEVCEKLKEDERTQNIPVIFLTAKTEPESIVRGFEVGATDYVTKPFNSSELLARVKTHLKLKKAESDLREANLTKDKFFSILAHDLRNPFQGVIGFAGLLHNNIEDYEFDKIKEFSKVIHEAAEHAYSLLENLLQWSRSQMGRIEWEPDNIVLKDLVIEVIKQLKPTSNNKNIDLYQEISENISVYTDSNMVKTIIRNLVFNSLKFTPEQGEVKVTAKKIKDFIEVTVSDTGRGINPEDMKKLFRIDVHHSTEGTGKEKGSALGLILCKEFVEKCGGKIWAESIQGVGSDFKFTLPLTEESIKTTLC